MSLPTGIIFLWYGSIATIPAGYVLCDGNNGTPDLRDRFLVGAGLSYGVGGQAGSVNHTHTFTGDGHSHNLQPGFGVNIGNTFLDTSSANPTSGTSDAGSSLPPYHALAYIMKT